MPRHKLEVIKLLIIASHPVKIIILNVLGPFPKAVRVLNTRYKIRDPQIVKAGTLTSGLSGPSIPAQKSVGAV